MLLRFLLAVSATAANLAQNRVPFGSSERWNEDFVKLTDGDLLSAWRSRSRETTETTATRRSGAESGLRLRLLRPAWRVPEVPFGQATRV